MINSTTSIQKMKDQIDRDRERVEEQLVGVAKNIIDKMERLLRDLDSGMHINGLGELQSRGSEVDRLCGIREQIVQHQNVANYLVAKEAE